MSKTEVFVKKFYKLIGINERYQLTIENISHKLKIEVFYWNYTSEMIEYFQNHKIFLSANLTEQRQWQDFGHEIGHFAWHRGSQQYITEHYIKYQENNIMTKDFFLQTTALIPNIRFTSKLSNTGGKDY